MMRCTEKSWEEMLRADSFVHLTITKELSLPIPAEPVYIVAQLLSSIGSGVQSVFVP